MPYMKDRIASAVLFCVAVAVFVASGDFSFTSSIFPRMIAVAMAIGSVMMFLRTLSFRSGLPAPAASDPNLEQPFFRNPRNFLITVCAFAIYLILISYLGYFTSTTLLIIALALLLGYRDRVTLAVTTAGFIALVYAVFIVIFARPLPRGVLF